MLLYGPAKQAISGKADQIAGAKTRITFMYRLGPLTYSGRAKWNRVNPTGCAGCGYDPATGQYYDTPTTEFCSVTLRAKLLDSGRIRVRTEDLLCF